jgi:putative copper export protein
MAASTETDRPFSQILQDIVANLQEIIRLEVRLAKAELREDARRGVSAFSIAVVGAVLGMYAVGLLLLALVYGLSNVVPAWLAALLVGVVVGVVAAVFLGVGARRVRRLDLKPERTIQSVKENVKWAKDQTR